MKTRYEFEVEISINEALLAEKVKEAVKEALEDALHLEVSIKVPKEGY